MLAVGALKNCPQGRQARRLVSPPQKRTLNSLTVTLTDSVERFSKHSVVCSFVYTTHPASAKCQELGPGRQQNRRQNSQRTLKDWMSVLIILC